MIAGIFGPASLLEECVDAREWLDIEWGTDDTRSALSRLTTGKRIDVLLVKGTMDFLVHDVLQEANRLGIAIWAFAEDTAANSWISQLDGVRRIATLDEAKPQILPVSPRSAPDPPTESNVRVTNSEAPGIIAVWGTVGAPGISTVAISLAAVAALHGQRVLLCDADSRGASLSIGLGVVDDVPGFAAACRLAGRDELSPQEIERLAIAVEKPRLRFDLLSGLPRASRWPEIAPPKSARVLTLLRDMYDCVIVDVGFGIEENEWVDGAPQRDGAARMVLREADVVVAVGSCSAVGISRLIRGLDELSEVCDNPLIVLNNATRVSGREARDAISRFTSHDVAATVFRDNRSGLEDALTRAEGSMRDVYRAVIQPRQPEFARGR